MNEYDYIMSISHELHQYLGKWIAVVGTDVVATSDSAKEVYELARKKYPNKEPFIMKVPQETVMLM